MLNNFGLTLHPNGFERKKIQQFPDYQKKDIKLCWIPNNIGIEGKNKADLAAKSALDIDVVSTTKISYTDFKEFSNKYIQGEWER